MHPPISKWVAPATLLLVFCCISAEIEVQHAAGRQVWEVHVEAVVQAMAWALLRVDALLWSW